MKIWRAKTRVIHLESCVLNSFPCICLMHLFHGRLSKVSEDSEPEVLDLSWFMLSWSRSVSIEACWRACSSSIKNSLVMELPSRAWQDLAACLAMPVFAHVRLPKCGVGGINAGYDNDWMNNQDGKNLWGKQYVCKVRAKLWGALQFN